MKKHILYITILLLSLVKAANSQTATISTVTGTYGSLQVNVNFANFTGANSIGALTLKIGFDTNVVAFTGITYGLIPSNIVTNVVGNEILIAWTNSPALPINGIAFKLNLTYTGGTSSLSFNSGCEIAGDLGGIITPTYINGAVNQPSLSTTAIISTQLGNYSIVNLLPVTFSGFPITPTASQVGALNLHFSYNTNNLQFTGISGLTNATAVDTNGIISIIWSNTTPINLNTLALKLKFNYYGGTTNVIYTGSNIVRNSKGVIIPVSLTNGGFTQPATSALVDIGDAVGQVSGTTTVPLTFSNFPINQGTIAMNIAYNTSTLNFVGTSGLAGLNSSASNGIINLTWNNSAGLSIPGFSLIFNYVSGSSALTFTGLNQITTNTGVLIPTSYTNGTVTQPAIPVSVSLGNTSLSSDSNTVYVPINLSSVYGNINSTTMYVNFDSSKLSYTGATNISKSGVSIIQDVPTKTLTIHWADANVANALGNGKFLDLKFTVNSAIGNCDLPVYFTTFNSSSSSLADNLGGAVAASWTNGNVNVTPAAPTATATQSFCSGASPTVANLTASGTSLKWYSTASGGTALASSTAVVNGNHYFASQTVGGCESTARRDVTVVVNASPSAPTGTSTQSFCSVTSPTVANLVASGNTIHWYNASSGGLNLATSTALIGGSHYYASQTIGSCESTSRLDVSAIVNTTPPAPTGNATQLFCSGANASVSNLSATGNSVQWYAASVGGTVLGSSTPLVSSIHYFASQSAAGCESSIRLDVVVQINPTPAAPGGSATQSFCSGTTPLVAALVASGNTIQWYAASSGGTALLTSQGLSNGNHYYASQTVGGCESIERFNVNTIVNTTPSAPVANTTQTFCSGANPLIANLSATGSSIQWYSTSVGGSALSAALSLIHGNHYFANQIMNGCESTTRTDVTANVNTTPIAPTASAVQSFSYNANISNLVASGSAISWYNSASGGSLYLSTDSLVNGTQYFASQTVGGCESSLRFGVTVIIVKTINLHLFLEGLFNTNTNTMFEAKDGNSALPYYGDNIADRIQVDLFDGNPPYAPIGVSISGIDLACSGLASFQISMLHNGDYFIRVSNRNHLATWSAIAVPFNSTIVNYYFTTNLLQAYGSNPQIQVSMNPDLYAFYLGDLDQSGWVDSEDFNLFEMDLTQGSTGFYSTDFNGGGWVDSEDFNKFEPRLTAGNATEYPGK